MLDITKTSPNSLERVLHETASSRRIKEQFTGEVGARCKEIENSEGTPRTATWLEVSQSDIFHALDERSKGAREALIQQHFPAGASLRLKPGPMTAASQPCVPASQPPHHPQEMCDGAQQPHVRSQPPPSHLHVSRGAQPRGSEATASPHPQHDLACANNPPPSPLVPPIDMLKLQPSLPTCPSQAAPDSSDGGQEGQVDGQGTGSKDPAPGDGEPAVSGNLLARHRLAQDIVDSSLMRCHELPYSIHRTWNPATNKIQALARPADFFVGPKEAHRRELESLRYSQRHVEHAKHLLSAEAATVARRQQQQAMASYNPFFNTPYHAHPRSTSATTLRPTSCVPYMAKWHDSPRSTSSSQYTPCPHTSSMASSFSQATHTPYPQRPFSAPVTSDPPHQQLSRGVCPSFPRPPVPASPAQLPPDSALASQHSPLLGASPSSSPLPQPPQTWKTRPSSAHPSSQPVSALPPSPAASTAANAAGPSSAPWQPPPWLQVGMDQEDNPQQLSPQQNVEGMCPSGQAQEQKQLLLHVTPSGRASPLGAHYPAGRGSPSLLARAISPIREEGQEQELSVSSEPSDSVCFPPELTLSPGQPQAHPQPEDPALEQQSGLSPARLPWAAHTPAPTPTALGMSMHLFHSGHIDPPSPPGAARSSSPSRPEARSPSPKRAASPSSLTSACRGPAGHPCPGSQGSLAAGAANGGQASPSQPLPLPPHLARPLSAQLQYHHYQQQLLLLQRSQSQKEQKQAAEGMPESAARPAAADASLGSAAPGSSSGTQPKQRPWSAQLPLPSALQHGANLHQPPPARPPSAQPRFSPTPTGAQPFQPRLHSLLRRPSSYSQPSSTIVSPASRPTPAAHKTKLTAPTAAAAAQHYQQQQQDQQQPRSGSGSVWGTAQLCTWQEVGGALDGNTHLRTRPVSALAHRGGAGAASRGVTWHQHDQPTMLATPVASPWPDDAASPQLAPAPQGWGADSTRSGHGSVAQGRRRSGSMVPSMQPVVQRQGVVQRPQSAHLPMSARARAAARAAQAAQSTRKEVEELSMITVTLPVQTGEGGDDDQDNRSHKLAASPEVQMQPVRFTKLLGLLC